MAQNEDPALQIIHREQVQGDDEEDTTLLLKMAEKAEHYIQSFPWCAALKEGIYADGFGGVIALFLFRADIKKLGDDQWTWVFVGDVPSTYLEMEGYKSPYEALERYIEGLDEWVAAARSGLPLNDLIPIEVPNDPELIESLATRIEALREHILPHISRNPITPSNNLHASNPHATNSKLRPNHRSRHGRPHRRPHPHRSRPHRHPPRSLQPSRRPHPHHS